MSELQREKFEKWAIGSYVLDKSRFGEYMAVKTNLAWQAWCAAIESVVVELPRPSSAVDYGYELNDIQSLLTDAGIKYE